MTDSYIGYEVECEGGGGPSTPSFGGTLNITEIARSTAFFSVPTTYADANLTFPAAIADGTRLILAFYQNHNAGATPDTTLAGVIHKGWLFFTHGDIPTETGLSAGDGAISTGEAITDMWDFYLDNSATSMALDENRKLFVRTLEGRAETAVVGFFILYTVG